MENKINIVELLKDCPTGMELDSTLFDDIYFDCIDDVCDIIKCYIQESKHKIGISFDKYGHYSNISKSKCVIFPKGKTTWEGFQRPFKDGDIVYYNDVIAIFKEWGDETLFRTYVTKYLCCDCLIDMNVPLFGKSIRKEIRFATIEEKEKLFNAIKENGYKWNPETKILEKLIESKFKVGDRIKSVISSSYYTVVDIKNNNYFIKSDTEKYPYQVSFENEINYELAPHPNKFDITTLKPFDKVLARCSILDKWHIQFFEKYDKTSKYPFICVGYNKYKECIPYEGNEHLLDTAYNCNDYYKNWK